MENISESVTIRDAQVEDMPLIYDFIYKLAVHEKRPEAMTASQERLQELIFGDGPASVILAFYDEEPVGFALYFPVVSTFSGHLNYYIEDLFVLPAYRLLGIGERLIQTLRDKDGVDGLKWTCLADNDSGLAFHNRIGATQGLASFPFFMDADKL